MRACVRRTRPQVAAALGTASSDCQDELAEYGAADFIDEYGEDATDTVDNAMAECIAEDADQILNPQDYVETAPTTARTASDPVLDRARPTLSRSPG